MFSQNDIRFFLGFHFVLFSVRYRQYFSLNIEKEALSVSRMDLYDTFGISIVFNQRDNFLYFIVLISDFLHTFIYIISAFEINPLLLNYKQYYFSSFDVDADKQEPLTPILRSGMAATNVSLVFEHDWTYTGFVHSECSQVRYAHSSHIVPFNGNLSFSPALPLPKTEVPNNFSEV
jgi:hypothetical protein